MQSLQNKNQGELRMLKKNRALPIHIFIILLMVSLYLTGCTKKENARNLKLEGLIELVCQGKLIEKQQPNACGDRSVWVEADLGFTAYLTIYGISNLDEAKFIVSYLESLEIKNQQLIPVQISFYTSPRSFGREPKNNELYQAHVGRNN